VKIVSDNLYVGLSFLRNIISPTPFVPILRNIKMVSYGTDELTLFGKNNEFGVIRIPAVVDEPFEAIVPYHTLLDLVAELRKSSDTLELTFNRNKTRLNVLYDSGSVSIALEDTTGFPLETEPDGYKYVLPKEDLLSVFGVEGFATGDKYILTMVHLENKQGALIAEATNAHSGGYTYVDMGGKPFDVVFPGNFARIISKHRIQEDTLTLQISTNMLFVSGETWYVGAQLHDAKYMNMMNLYKNSGHNHLTINKSLLLDKLRILRILSVDDMIYLDITANGVSLSVNSSKGDADEDLGVNDLQDVVPVSVGLSYRGLTQIVSLIDADEIILQVGTNMEPLLIGNDKSLYFIIPMRHNKKGV